MSELLSIKKNQLINSKRDSDLIFNQYTTLEKNNSIKFDKLIKKYDDFKMTMMEKLKEEEEFAKILEEYDCFPDSDLDEPIPKVEEVKPKKKIEKKVPVKINRVINDPVINATTTGLKAQMIRNSLKSEYVPEGTIIDDDDE